MGHHKRMPDVAGNALGAVAKSIISIEDRDRENVRQALCTFQKPGNAGSNKLEKIQHHVFFALGLILRMKLRKHLHLAEVFHKDDQDNNDCPDY